MRLHGPYFVHGAGFQFWPSGGVVLHPFVLFVLAGHLIKYNAAVAIMAVPAKPNAA